MSLSARSTKIHTLTDVLDQLGVLLKTGDASDITVTSAVLTEPPGRINRLSADKS